MVGKLPEHILAALLDAVPLEFTVIDEQDRIIAWNKGDERMLTRSVEILGSDIRDCHTHKSMDMLERLLEEMKAGERESARFWFDDDTGDASVKRKLLVEYFALRDPGGNYIGCFSSLQDIGEIRTLSGEKRSLD